MTEAGLQIRVAGAAFAAMLVSSPAVLSINPLLMAPMAAEFGWGRSALAAGYVIAAPVMAGMYLLVGPAVDRYGVRPVALPGFVLFAVALAATALLSGSMAQYLALKAVTAACASLVAGIAFGKVVSSHFSAHRGLFLGLCLGGGGGLGMTVLPLVGHHLFTEYGWRGTYVGMGVIVLVIGVPAVLALPHDRSAQSRAEDGRAGERVSAALRDGTFQLLLVATFLSYALLNGIFAHLAAIMTDAGLSAATGALALALYAAAATVSQFLIGPVLDRSRSPRIGAAAMALAVIGIAVIGLSDAQPLLLTAASLLGIGSGTISGLLPYVLPRYFGLEAFGTLYAWIFAAAALGVGAGPYGMGIVFDRTHSYHDALLVYGIVALGVLVIVALLPRYRRAAHGLHTPHREGAGCASAPPPFDNDHAITDQGEVR